MGFSSARNLGRDISAGFSPPRRMPISEAVKKFMRVPKGAGNSVQRKSELLEQRAEPVPSRSVPDGINFLVATVDVQAGRHRRFVVQVTGYGSRGERWIIDRYNITQSLRSDCDGESQRIDPAS
ncbi:hypothetical protein D9F08_22295 [Escherichia coli]|nr:hypothetical protein [Escherichia coli]